MVYQEEEKQGDGVRIIFVIDIKNLLDGTQSVKRV